MNTKQLFTCILLISGTLFFSGIASASDNVIIVKGGTYELDDNTQTVDYFPTTNAVFEQDGATLSVEYDHVFDNNVSIGGGYQSFNLDYTSNFGSGDMTASFIMFNSKIYFTDSMIKPFIGASVGLVATDFTGGISGNTIGFTAAGMAGIRMQFSTVGLYLEYKNFFTADTEDSEDAEVDLAGDSITGGLSFQF